MSMINSESGSARPPVALRRSARLSSAIYKSGPTMRPQQPNSSSSSSSLFKKAKSRGGLIKPKSTFSPPRLRLTSCPPGFDGQQHFLDNIKRFIMRFQGRYRYGPEDEKRTCILSFGDTFSWTERSSATSWIAVNGIKTLCVVSMKTSPDEKTIPSPGVKLYPPHHFTMEKALYEMRDKSGAFRQMIARRSEAGPFAVVSVAPGTIEDHQGSSSDECQCQSRAIKFLEAKIKNRSALTFEETIQTAVCALKYLLGSKFDSSEIWILGYGGHLRSCTNEIMTSSQVNKYLDAGLTGSTIYC
ncbi:hypothetical protein OROMI_015515 [Orobanche minor]